VASSTGPVEVTAGGAIFGGGRMFAQYNADLGWGQFLNAGFPPADAIMQYNYLQVTSRELQHVNVMIKLPGPGTINNYIQNFNAVYWDKSAWRLTGTGTLDEFVAQTSGAAGPTTTVLSQSKNNVIITNNSINGGPGKVTNSLLRILNQNGGSTANVNYELADGTLTVTAVNRGGPLKVNDYVNCGPCSKPIQITSVETGAGAAGTYKVSNATDRMKLANQPVYPFPGRIGTLDWSQNYLDATGAQTVFTTDYGNVPVGNTINSGNVNMLSGGACSIGSGNCP
jgi:hypothetical protein